MGTDMDAPIALRKTKRRSSVLSSPDKPRAALDTTVHAKTPSSRRSKRVRFSDPGLFSPSSGNPATSLTPAFRRSSLNSPRNRRPATPGRAAIEGSIQFTPFTQVLDERCQRRIRRNHLSEELNTYEADKRSRTALQKEIEDKDAELKRLRAELEEAKMLQTPALDEQHGPPPSSQQRVDEVEAELEALRQSFAEEGGHPVESWNHVSRASGPNSDGGDTILIHEDDDADSFPSHQPSRDQLDSDALSMGLELEAARQAKTSFLSGSFPDNNNSAFDLQFADTPARQQQQQTSSWVSTFQIPDTPVSFHHDLSKKLKETEHRAEEAELALTALDIEVSALGFGGPNDDTMTMITAIASHFRTARLELERLVPGESTSSLTENSAVLPELLKKLKLLSQRLKSRETDLKNAKDQHHNLKGNFEKAIIAAEKANEQIKKLETQFDSTVEETLHMRMRTQQLEKDLTEKEADIACLSNALNKYRNDVTRLENLINNMQTEYDSKTNTKLGELSARVDSETAGRRAAELSAVQRLARINELETTLATTRRHATDLEAQLSTFKSSDLTSSQQRTQEIGALNTRISNLATAFASANAEIEKLRVTKQKLEERVRSEVEQGARAVENLQDQLIRTVMKGNEARKRYVNGAKVRIANWEIDDEREMSSDPPSGPGSEDAMSEGRRTPSLVKFAEWAEVETIERASEQGSFEGQNGESVAVGEESGSESVPGSVEVRRGRGRYKTPKLVSYDKARRSGAGLGIDAGTDEGVGVKRGKRSKRRYDSGIGMSDDSEFGDEEGVVSSRTGMMTPEMSSDGDLDLDAEREVADVMQ